MGKKMIMEKEQIEGKNGKGKSKAQGKSKVRGWMRIKDW